MKNLIKHRNSKILNETPANKKLVTVDAKKAQSIVFNVTIGTQQSLYMCNETSEGEFNLRFSKNNPSLKDCRNTNKPDLLKYIWQLDENHIAFNLECEIAAYPSPYECGTV